jgi:hypothetical protein
MTFKTVLFLIKNKILNFYKKNESSNQLIRLIFYISVRNLMSIRYFFNSQVSRLVNSKYFELEKCFKKSQREYLRGDAYIRHKLEARHKYLDLYKIPGTLNFDPNRIYEDPKTYPNFQTDLEKFKNELINYVNQNKCKTYYRFGDGEYYFLTKQAIGSARPGFRAINKTFEEINHKEFVDGVLKNDFVCTLLYPENRSKFKELFPERKIDYPSEYIYGLMPNKWFLRTFKGKIGLIGAKEKLQLIEELLKYKEYQDFLGIEKFNDYINIPQRFAADDVHSLEKIVSEQLANSNSAIFLVGIGHVKSILLHRFKKYKQAVYVDVGSGIDAIAGTINIQRPYLGKWINFRIKNYDYSVIDDLTYKGMGKHIFLE